MADTTLVDNLRKLAKKPGTFRQSRLDAVNSTPDLFPKIGVGSLTKASAGSDSSPTSYTEILVIYSVVLVTESGTFELPSNWPVSNNYPGFTFPEPELPILGDSYVLQRRSHAYMYLTNTGSRVAHHLLTSYAKPFTSVPLEITFPVSAGSFQPLMHSFKSATVEADETMMGFALGYGITV